MEFLYIILLIPVVIGTFLFIHASIHFVKLKREWLEFYETIKDGPKKPDIKDTQQ